MPLSVPYLSSVNIQYATPGVGDTVVVSGGTDVLILEPAGTIASATVTLPSDNLYNGRIVRISSTQIITSLTMNGGSILNGMTAMTAGGRVSYIYRAANTSWYITG